MENQDIVEKAKNLALKIHESDTRISGENYFWHLHRVEELLEQNNVTDPEILAGAYLHHSLDHKEINKQTIEKEFGVNIAEIVSGYQNISNNEVSSIDPANINENLIVQTYLNLIKNPKTLVIRLADKVDNIRSVYVLPKENAEKIAIKAMFLYSPICQLLGLHKFVVELENEAFKILQPGDYYSIESYLKKRLPEMTTVLEDTSNYLSETLRENNIEAEVDYRIKHSYSIYRKVLKYRKANNYRGLNQVMDLAAMRILVKTVEDCYRVEDFLKQIWNNIPEERDDYIAKPKPGGYQSIHNTYKVTPNLNLEIQIKTFDMHEVNEYGVASHTFYKTGERLKNSLQNSPDWLKEINISKSKGDIRIDQFNRYVYVFTPKGDIKQLPRGSTPVDFAYAIHKDLGNSCVGVSVNGGFQKLSYPLRDGDRVEIKTLKNKKIPSSDWLDIVKTRRARENIRKALRFAELTKNSTLT